MLQPISRAEERGLKSLNIAEHQEEYLTLPALFNPATGAVITEWVVSPEDREKIANGANLRLAIWTGGAPLQPLYPCIEEHELEEVKAL